eukprot:1138765-Pelagomonas_calceolata.AAC.3
MQSTSRCQVFTKYQCLDVSKICGVLRARTEIHRGPGRLVWPCLGGSSHGGETSMSACLLTRHSSSASLCALFSVAPLGRHIGICINSHLCFTEASIAFCKLGSASLHPYDKGLLAYLWAPPLWLSVEWIPYEPNPLLPADL